MQSKVYMYTFSGMEAPQCEKGVDFFQKGVDFFQKGVAFFPKGVRMFMNNVG